MATGRDGQPTTTTGILSIPKEGERIIAPSRRPDGTLRKAIRIRAGYVPQEEVAIYQPKGALLRRAQPEVPPGYDPDTAAPTATKAKSKSTKRNERRKEKRQQQAALDKGKNPDLQQVDDDEDKEVCLSVISEQRMLAVDSITDRMASFSILETAEVDRTPDCKEGANPESSTTDIDKKIRALKKKIRLAEMQLPADAQSVKAEQLERLKKVSTWHEELKVLERKKS